MAPWRRFRLRTILAFLVLAITLPLALFAGLLIWRTWHQQQTLVDAQNAEQATAIADAIDQQVERAIAALEILAVLDPIDEPDKTHFIEIAARTLPIHPGWASIRIIDPSFRVLARTAPDEAPVVRDPAWIRTIIESRAPQVSGLNHDSGRSEWYVSVGVPVLRRGTLISVLVARIHARTFSEALRRQRVDESGVVTLIDATPVIIARTRNEDTYRGKPPTPDFVALARAAPEGSWRTRTLEGMEAYSAWRRSALTGWTVGIALPAATVDGPVRRSLFALIGAGLAILAAGMALALVLSADVVRAQASALRAARALARGDTVPAFPSRVIEAEELSAGLQEAGAILRARLRERDDAQLEADRHRAALLEREQAARKSAEALNRAKDEFVATVSHELRTPLNAIFGWVALLKTGTLDAERQKHALEVIDRNTRAQGQLVEDLLDMSRVIRGAVRLDMRPVDLCAVLEATLDAVRPTAAARHVSLATDDPCRVIVSADHGRLQQILWNLLSNSLKFTPAGGRIHAAVAIDGHDAMVRITDSGEGIAPEFLPHVFDRFRQEFGDATRLHSGLGIGLSLVRHLSELHGGSVTAESRGKNQGATFTIRLPLLADGAVPAGPAAPAPVRLPQSGERVLEGLRILTVGDDTDGRDLLATALQQAGARVTNSATVAEALSWLGDEATDLVVYDLAIPGGSGSDLLQALRADPRTAAIPVVAITAYPPGDERGRALADEFDAHVAKPFEPRALVGLLASLARP